jgi:hypothetical protein
MSSDASSGKNERAIEALMAARAERDQAYLAFGKAMAAWAMVEVGFYIWFEHIADLNTPQAKPIYYAATAFKARLDLIRGAIDGNELPAAERTFIDEAMKLANPYSAFRNKLAHGEFTIDGLIIEGKHADRRRALAEAISPVELKTFTERFNAFADLLYRGRDLALGFEDHDDGELTLEGCTARIVDMRRELNDEKSRGQR